jgi:hypothetical protein
LFKALWVYFILRSGARCGKSYHRLRQRATSLAKGHQVEKVLFRVIKVIFDSSYLLETLQGDSLPRAVNSEVLEKVLSKCLARGLECSPNNGQYKYLP